MTYPHRLRVTRTARAPDGMGGTTEGEETVVYESRADVQDGGAKAEVGGGGVVEGEGDAAAFLPGSVAGVQVGDAVTIAWGSGGERAATVAQVHRLDDKLILSYD